MIIKQEGNHSYFVSKESLSLDEKTAFEIVESYLGKKYDDNGPDWGIYSQPGDKWITYNHDFKDFNKYWFVSCPWYDGFDEGVLRSSRVIVVSRKTHEILFDGSVQDEG